ncbi:MAG: hypothetical protein WCO75_07810, partial [Planctomycetota bacterium]
MRLFAASVFIIVASSSALVHADMIAQNLPYPATLDPTTGRYTQDGTFSDALQSGGSYYYSQAIGQSFSIGSGHSSSISDVTFWGSSEYINSNAPWNQTSLSSNIVGMQISILRTDSGSSNFPIVKSWSIQASQFSQVLTGNYTTDTYSPVLQISAALSGNFTLSSGNYMITIGGILNNPDGDAFAWTDGLADGSVPATQAYATVGDIPTEWGTWIPISDGTSGAFILNGTATPVPGAIALLGVA